MFNSRIIKVLFVVTAVMVMAGASYAFAAANTFTTPPTKIGDSGVAISGYTVTNVAYSFGADPGNITAVEFDLNATAVTVKIQLVQTTGAIYDCTNALLHWTCATTTPQATAATTDVLRVIANDITP